MDWYSWLSESGLRPSLVYDYSLLFADNELEEEDVAGFDHEFLKSMGVSVAKHRLEILKLARRRKPAVCRLLAAVARRTKKRLSKCIHTPVDTSAIVVVPKPAYVTGGLRRRRGAVTKSKEGPKWIPAPRATSPAVYGGREHYYRDDRWDSMFRNMKPT